MENFAGKAQSDRILREQRREADRFFNTQMKNADGYGRAVQDAKTPFQKKEAEAKVREAQSQMNKALQYKMAQNRKIGRSLQDGYDF